MDWTITLHQDEFVGMSGIHYPEKTATCKIPFKQKECVYLSILKRSKWMLVRTSVVSMWADDTYGITVAFKNMRSPWCEFNTVFKDKNEAIEFCLKKNEQAKVKIHYDIDY